jgi:hypothetical protein
MGRSGVSGDGFASLERWARKVEKAGSTAGLQSLAANLCEEAIELVAEGFERETDPYGKAWARKRFPDGRQVLVGNTARLRRGWHRKSVSSGGFTIAPSVKYARYAQHGRGPVRAKPGKALRFMVGGKAVFRKSVGPAPARKMVPDRGRLPDRWRKSLLIVARSYFKGTFGRA